MWSPSLCPSIKLKLEVFRERQCAHLGTTGGKTPDHAYQSLPAEGRTGAGNAATHPIRGKKNQWHLVGRRMTRQPTLWTGKVCKDTFFPVYLIIFVAQSPPNPCTRFHALSCQAGHSAKRRWRTHAHKPPFYSPFQAVCNILSKTQSAIWPFRPTSAFPSRLSRYH